MTKLVFFITNTPMTLKCGYYVNMPEGILKHKYIRILQVFISIVNRTI